MRKGLHKKKCFSIDMYTHDPDWPAHGTDHFHTGTSIGLANGEILIFYNNPYNIHRHPLYSFDGDEWTKRIVEIPVVNNSSMENDTIVWQKNDTLFWRKNDHVQILTIKNYNKDR